MTCCQYCKNPATDSNWINSEAVFFYTAPYNRLICIDIMLRCIYIYFIYKICLKLLNFSEFYCSKSLYYIYLNLVDFEVLVYLIAILLKMTNFNKNNNFNFFETIFD